LKLKSFKKFANTAEALSAATALVEGKLSGDLKDFLKAELDEKTRLKETLAVSDAKLGASIAKKLNIKVVSDSTVLELMRGIRSQISSLISGTFFDNVALG
jgi:nucleolar protein 58